jgi:hypothetical protein
VNTKADSTAQNKLLDTTRKRYWAQIVLINNTNVSKVDTTIAATQGTIIVLLAIRTILLLKDFRKRRGKRMKWKFEEKETQD